MTKMPKICPFMETFFHAESKRKSWAVESTKHDKPLEIKI